VAQQSTGEQQPDRAGAGHRNDHRQRRAARAEGQGATSSTDRASRDNGRGGHPVGRTERGI
jgi:hypothetical protein